MTNIRGISGMHRHRIRLLVIFCLAILGIFGLAMLVILGRPVSRKVKRCRFADHILLGDRTVKSNLVIECDITDYNMPFSEFRNSAANPDEKRVADFISALFSGNIDKAKALAKPTPEMNGMKPDIEKELSRLSSGLMLLSISPDNLKILRRIYSGNDDFFVCQMPAANSLRTSIFHFERDPDKGLLWARRLKGHERMLCRIARRMEKFPEDYGIEPSGSHRYRLRVTPQDSEHPVDLLFNGYAPGIEQGADESQLSETALLFHQTAMADIKKAETIEECRKVANTYFDTYSRSELLERIDKDYQMFLKTRNALVDKERELIFVMDVDPVFIIFYICRPTRSSLSHVKLDYVIREEGKFLIARLALGDDLSGYFTNRKEFIEPLLMPLIKSQHRGR